MYDLVYRKSVKKAVTEEWDTTWAKYSGSQIIDDTNAAIDAIPSAPAVPLDKLCEWLSEYTVPCKLGIRCEYAVDFTCMSDKDCWRYVLKKWMEGLDAEVH